MERSHYLRLVVLDYTAPSQTPKGYMQSHSTEDLAMYFMPNYFILIAVVPQHFFITVSESGGFVTKSAKTSAPKTIWVFQGRNILFICPKPVFVLFFVLNESLNLFFYNKDYFIDLKLTK